MYHCFECKLNQISFEIKFKCWGKMNFSKCMEIIPICQYYYCLNLESVNGHIYNNCYVIYKSQLRNIWVDKVLTD